MQKRILLRGISVVLDLLSALVIPMLAEKISDVLDGDKQKKLMQDIAAEVCQSYLKSQ